MSSRHPECTHGITEPCRLHPVDCENCIHGDVCRMSATMKAHPDKIKSCRFFEGPPAQRTLT